MPAARLAADVRIRDLTKHYGRLAALRGISFDVAAGEIFGLLGPNGAGKTTTLECLLGLRRADAGALHVGGIDALAQPEDVRQIVGAQLQAATLQDKITPRQALQLAASFYAEPCPPDELLERFGLHAKAHAAFDTLSGGQKQRVLLALAFVNRPRLVVLDEPTAGLDPQSRRELHAVIRQLRADGCTILLSTHQLDEAGQLCDRIGILHEGRLVADAPPSQLIAGARALPKVVFTTAQPLTATMVSGLHGVASVAAHDGGWCADTRDVSGTITALTRQLERDGNPLIGLQIQRPTLEDVFLELTGRAWMPPANPLEGGVTDERNTP
ncbi:ABC transporter ATP-binding protein [Opitutus terrae]|uniref:ABC transporter related n=1 Tax=Opitutus terrae (strain DSM 11246 / JCM 15787 / PB90-1) TaxID=452637 RepID=B1ZW98_OPITP|nr:ABC transporter ATP-binding protein [Opitutus terrae]ACB76850.1 ABC transporter related [Opitutus terrae PB90-1]